MTQQGLQLFDLAGRSALVTGGGQGIGKSLARALAEAGASVAVADLNFETGSRTAEDLARDGLNAIAVKVDVGDRASVVEMVGKTVAAFGRLDIAFNNAGVNFNSAAEDTTAEEWDTTFAVNLRGVFFCCQQEARQMIGQGGGVIINMASMSSLIVPHPQKQAAYNTAKAGVAHLTRSLAAEWATKNIRVNAMSPGLINTDLLQSEALRGLRGEWLPQIPMGRFGEVDDLRGAIVFLASDASRYMTGQNLVLDGGVTLW